MTESAAHRSMKLIVRRELEAEGYSVVEEPLFPPSRRVSWTCYRPDLLAHRDGAGTEEVAIVECETHPCMGRFRAKNFSSLWFQPFLFRNGAIRRILAVPQGKLRSVDLGLRSEWEIWVLGPHGPIVRAGRLGTNPLKAREVAAGALMARGRL